MPQSGIVELFTKATNNDNKTQPDPVDPVYLKP